MAKEKTCTIKITSGDETIPLNPFDKDNPTFLTLNKDGTYSMTGSETIELLPDIPGEKVFITMNEDISCASEMSKEELLQEFTKKAYEYNRKEAVKNIVSSKDMIISQLSGLSKIIESRSYNSMKNISLNLRTITELLDDFVKFEEDFGPLVYDDDLR